MSSGRLFQRRKNNIYFGHTTTTLSRRLSFHLNDMSNISKHLKQHTCPHSQFRKILVENTFIFVHENNKHKLKILEAIYIK